MVEATESKFFTQLKAKSLNALQNTAPWSLDQRQQIQIETAMNQAKYRLEEGILLNLKLQREKELERFIAQKCYQRKDLSIQQAEMCEQYYFSNDFKLNLIRRFADDYLSKQVVEIEKCFKGVDFDQLPSAADKDRAFLACKQTWRSNLFNNVVPDLEVKAKELLQ